MQARGSEEFHRRCDEGDAWKAKRDAEVLAELEASSNAIRCPGCDRVTDDWERFYDCHGIYSGRACSERCARVLPGQGDMLGYEAEEPIEAD